MVFGGFHMISLLFSYRKNNGKSSISPNFFSDSSNFALRPNFFTRFFFQVIYSSKGSCHHVFVENYKGIENRKFRAVPQSALVWPSNILVHSKASLGSVLWSRGHPSPTNRDLWVIYSQFWCRKGDARWRIGKVQYGRRVNQSHLVRISHFPVTKMMSQKVGISHFRENPHYVYCQDIHKDHFEVDSNLIF